MKYEGKMCEYKEERVILSFRHVNFHNFAIGILG